MSKRNQGNRAKHEMRYSHAKRSAGKSPENRPERFAGKPLVAQGARRGAASARSAKAVQRAAYAEELKREQVVLDKVCAPFSGRTLAIVGGGAAGLAAAVRAGEICVAQRRSAAASAVRIVVFEACDRVGKTILVTGNGRCNFSNENIDPQRYYQGEFVAAARQALARQDAAPASASAPETGSAGASAIAQDAKAALRVGASGAARRASDSVHADRVPLSALDPVHRFFAAHGLLWREEEDGRQYPLANKASVIVNLLRQALADCGVAEAVGASVVRIEPPREQSGPFTLHLADGRFARADAVIIAVGGKPQAIDIDGVPQLRFRRVLGPLKTAGDEMRELNNIRAKAQVTLLRNDDRAPLPDVGEAAPDAGGSPAYPGRRVVARERGEVMFRTYGVSGIAVFNLSRYAWPGDELSIDFLSPGGALSPDDFAKEHLRVLEERAQTLGVSLTCARFLSGIVLPVVASVILKRCDLAASDPCTESEAIALARQLADFRLTVAGIGDEANCQVHRGGIDVAALDSQTMAVRLVPGLFAAGEAVDVDGPCGGYNLDWAWTSGLLAADAACRFLAGADAENPARESGYQRKSAGRNKGEAND